MASVLRHRQIRTTQERRANQECWHRGGRGKKRLPNSWDDFVARRERSWKHYRRTQHKVTPPAPEAPALVARPAPA